MIVKIVKLATFVPWILYFIEIMLYRISVIEKVGFTKDKYFKYLNKNLFKSINIKELVLFCIFIIFMRFNKTIVLEMLFTATYVYLLIDFFFTVAKDCAKIKHKFLMVCSVILTCLIILYFLLTNRLYTTYNLMFIVSILSSFIMYVFGLGVKDRAK